MDCRKMNHAEERVFAIGDGVFFKKPRPQLQKKVFVIIKYTQKTVRG